MPETGAAPAPVCGAWNVRKQIGVAASAGLADRGRSFNVSVEMLVMRETTENQTAQPGVVALIEQVYRMLTAKALEGRAQVSGWDDRRHRAVGATAVFHTDADAPQAIAQAYRRLVEEAGRYGPIVLAHRPYCWGGDEGFTFELGVDVVVVAVPIPSASRR